MSFANPVWWVRFEENGVMLSRIISTGLDMTDCFRMNNKKEWMIKENPVKHHYLYVSE